MLRKFEHCFRYIDDLLALNNHGLLQHYCKDFYHANLDVKHENKLPTEGTFLDLCIKVADKKFQRTLYDKRNDYDFEVNSFPPLPANVHYKIAHGVIIGQLRRFAKANDLALTLFPDAQTLTSRLLKQGFNKPLLYKKCLQFEKHYASLLSKFKLKSTELTNKCFS